MLANKLNLNPKSLVLAISLLLVFYAPNAFSNKEGTRITVIALAMPTESNPNADHLVNNIVKDTFEQLRSAATNIVTRQNLVGVGIYDTYVTCEDFSTDDKFSSNSGCGRYKGKELPLRYTPNKVQQRLVQEFYEDMNNGGDRFKSDLCVTNKFIGMLYINASNFNIFVRDLESNNRKTELKLGVTAYVRGSNHENTSYLETEFFFNKNQWVYDQAELKAKIEDIAQDTYDKVLKANNITYSNGTAALDGF